MELAMNYAFPNDSYLSPKIVLKFSAFRFYDFSYCKISCKVGKHATNCNCTNYVLISSLEGSSTHNNLQQKKEEKALRKSVRVTLANITSNPLFFTNPLV